MTALHPLADKSKVRGVVASRYPINAVCAHPLCDKPTESRHHVFAASKIGNRAWFVVIGDEAKVTTIGDKGTLLSGDAIPHVVGLCGSGSTGHHGDAEEHRAWIKYDDGIFTWWERTTPETPAGGSYGPEEWKEVGPLDPQPGARIKHLRPKKRDRRSDGQPRARSRYTFAIPVDEQENGADLIDQALDDLEARINGDEEQRRSRYYTLIDGLNFALLNSGPEDFS